MGNRGRNMVSLKTLPQVWNPQSGGISIILNFSLGNVGFVLHIKHLNLWVSYQGAYPSKCLALYINGDYIQEDHRTTENGGFAPKDLCTVSLTLGPSTKVAVWKCLHHKRRWHRWVPFLQSHSILLVLALASAILALPVYPARASGHASPTPTPQPCPAR